MFGITPDNHVSPVFTSQFSMSLQLSGLSHMKFGGDAELRSEIKAEALVPAGTTWLQSVLPGWAKAYQTNGSW